jgi:hypothetical protein
MGDMEWTIVTLDRDKWGDSCESCNELLGKKKILEISSVASQLAVSLVVSCILLLL